MYILLSIFWFVWEIKYILFWLYLWQLKDYHTGRFIDHFRTYKGKELVINSAQILKIILLALFLVSDGLFIYLFYLVFLVYLFEVIVFLRGIFAKTARRPAITLKILFLTAISFAVVILFLDLGAKFKNTLQPAFLLGFDVLTPLIISIIVLLFQPFFVLLRNNTLKKAKKRIEEIRSASGLKVIAITGSYGKTATKEFLSTILSKKYKVLKTKAHQNSEIGVAKCILEDLKPEHQIFIAEVGAYNKGKVKEVCSFLKPQIGIVTGVNEQHMALFGSLANLLSAEGGGELADSLPEDGIMVVNGDNKYCLELCKRTIGSIKLNRKIYSLSNKVIDSDIWADSITIHKTYISFVAIDKTGEMMHFEVKVLGKQNVQNLLGAILMAKELGMNFGQIADACKDIFEGQAGMILKQEKHGIYIADSSYSANPDGVYADLDYLSIYQGKRVIVMPCLIELGVKSSEIHEKIGRKIAEVCDLAIITTKDKFAEIERGFNDVKGQKEFYALRPTGINIARCLLCDKPKDIYSIITIFCKSGDAVLLEGRVPSALIRFLV